MAKNLTNSLRHNVKSESERSDFGELTCQGQKPAFVEATHKQEDCNLSNKKTNGKNDLPEDRIVGKSPMLQDNQVFSEEKSSRPPEDGEKDPPMC